MQALVNLVFGSKKQQEPGDNRIGDELYATVAMITSPNVSNQVEFFIKCKKISM